MAALMVDEVFMLSSAFSAVRALVKIENHSMVIVYVMLSPATACIVAP